MVAGVGGGALHQLSAVPGAGAGLAGPFQTLETNVDSFSGRRSDTYPRASSSFLGGLLFQRTILPLQKLLQDSRPHVHHKRRPAAGAMAFVFSKAAE